MPGILQARGWQTVHVPPTVSVVVPVFNGMAHLAETVDSILAQTYRDLDIVLVDGGSSDGSREWIEGVDDPRVRTAQMPAGTGAAATWTASCAAARGEFVKLVCQDDLLQVDAIALQVDDLREHPEALMAVARRDVIDARGATLFHGWGCHGLSAGLVSGHDALIASYIRGTNIFGEPLAVLFRRRVIDDALPWNDDQPFILDLELYTRVMRSGPIVVRKTSIGAFRVSASSWSTRLVSQQIDQLRHWQEGVAATVDPSPTAAQRMRARLMLREQMLVRRLAYRILKLRGSFHAPAQDKLSA